MPRIRTIKPGFHSDEELSKLSVETHYFASGLLNYADDFGYFNANPGLIQGQIFPLRKFVQAIADMLDQLAELGWIQLGSTPDGKRWGWVVKFNEHQKISHQTASRIKILSIQWDKKIPETSGNSPESSVKPSAALRPEKEEEREEEGEVSAPESRRPSPEIQIKTKPREFTPEEAAVVLCDWEHLNLSGRSNLTLATEVVGKAVGAWDLVPLAAVDRIAENWRAYQSAKDPPRKEKAQFWLSGGCWNVAIVSKQTPLSLPEKRMLQSRGVTNFNRPANELRQILKGDRNGVN